MKECEREEGRGGIWRVRHWGVQNGGECVSVRKERERLEAYRKEAGGWYSG